MQASVIVHPQHLVKAGRIGADSTSLESSLQAVADYDAEVRLFFTLPDSTLDRAEMDRAKGLADVLLAVPAVEVVLFDTLTDMIASHSPMAKTAERLRQYINDRMSSHGLRPGMKQEAYMAQTQGPMAMSAQHMPMPMYSPASFVSMSGAQGCHAPQPVQQPPPTAQYAPQPMQQAHMVQQAHEMQRALHITGSVRTISSSAAAPAMTSALTCVGRSLSRLSTDRYM